MRFPAIVTVEPGVVGPDPVASPADVPPTLLLRLPSNPAPTEAPSSATWAVLDAPAAESVTVDVYVLDEGSDVDPNADDPTIGLGARRFFLWQTGVSLTGGTVTSLMPAGSPACSLGVLYLCPTADTLTTARFVRGNAS